MRSGRGERKREGRETNAKVLKAFRTHLFRAGLSEKVVGRDLAGAAAFAEGYLLDRPEPHSLRELSSRDVEGYAAGVRASALLAEGRKREILTGLTRLVKFLRDTDRVDNDSASAALGALKGKR